MEGLRLHRSRRLRGGRGGGRRRWAGGGNGARPVTPVGRCTGGGDGRYFARSGGRPRLPKAVGRRRSGVRRCHPRVSEGGGERGRRACGRCEAQFGGTLRWFWGGGRDEPRAGRERGVEEDSDGGSTERTPYGASVGTKKRMGHGRGGGDRPAAGSPFATASTAWRPAPVPQLTMSRRLRYLVTIPPLLVCAPYYCLIALVLAFPPSSCLASTAQPPKTNDYRPHPRLRSARPVAPRA